MTDEEEARFPRCACGKRGVIDTTGKIEVVGVDMMCFLVDAKTLEPISRSYYEPAAWSDPRCPQMGINEWQSKRCLQRAA
jgi:hypothetical protein